MNDMRMHVGISVNLRVEDILMNGGVGRGLRATSRWERSTGMRVGAFASEKGRVTAKKIKMSGYRSESRNISKTVLQNASTRPAVSNAGSRGHVGKVGTYGDGHRVREVSFSRANGTLIYR